MRIAEKGGCGGLVSVGVVEDVIIEFIRFFFFFNFSFNEGEDQMAMVICSFLMGP